MNQPANIQPAMALEDILNLERYPIDRLESPEGQAVVELAREGLDQYGCCCLPDFVRPEALELMKAEIEAGYDEIFWSETRTIRISAKKTRASRKIIRVVSLNIAPVVSSIQI